MRFCKFDSTCLIDTEEFHDGFGTIHIIKLSFHKDFHFQCFIPFDQGIRFIHVKSSFLPFILISINFNANTLFFFIISWTRRANNALYNVVYMKLRNMNESFIIVQKHSKKVHFRKIKIILFIKLFYLG